MSGEGFRKEAMVACMSEFGLGRYDRVPTAFHQRLFVTLAVCGATVGGRDF
jgi:hypothetical protein